MLIDLPEEEWLGMCVKWTKSFLSECAGRHPESRGLVTKIKRQQDTMWVTVLWCYGVHAGKSELFMAAYRLLEVTDEI